jgi:hypothetical protein
MSLSPGNRPGRPILPVLEIVGEAYRHVARNRSVFVLLAALPIIAQFAAELLVLAVFPVPPSILVELAMILLSTALVASFSVAWHRFTLLGEVNKQHPSQFVFEQREGWFFVYTLILIVPMFVAKIAAQTPGSLLPPVLMGLAVFCFVRLCVLLPAIAVDGDRDPRRAWQLTQGHFWRLFGILFLSALPMQFVGLILLLTIQGAGLFGMVVANAFASVLEFVMTAVVVSVLSLVYRALIGLPPPAPVGGPGSRELV